MRVCRSGFDEVALGRRHPFGNEPAHIGCEFGGLVEAVMHRRVTSHLVWLRTVIQYWGVGADLWGGTNRGSCQCATGADTSMCSEGGSTSGRRCRTNAQPRYLGHGSAPLTNSAVLPGLAMCRVLITPTLTCHHKGATAFVGETALVENA